MANKYYGLTEQPTSGGKDSVPDWMDGLLDNLNKKTDNPFKGCNNLYLYGTDNDKTCKLCGKKLKDGQVEFCPDCL